MSDARAQADHAWELMERIKVGLLVTHDQRGGELRARPVHAHPAPGENAIYFLTDADSAKVYEIADNRNVCIAFADASGQKYVSVSGTASVSDDRAKIKEFWTASDKSFWTDENDPRIRVVRIDVSEAEYWDNFSTAFAAIKIAISAVTGAKPNLGENAKVDLKRSGPD
jgi:general stress protein 26